MKTASAVRLVVTCIGLFVLLPDAGARIAAASSSGQSETLARLVLGILTCGTHPCAEDSPDEIRALLQHRIVSDGFFQYSGLSQTYPDIGAGLKGVVEWDLQRDDVDEPSLIVVGFDDSRESLKSAMEGALPGCIIEPTPGDDDDAPADDPAGAVGAKPEDWDCDVNLPDDEEADITIHVAPGTLYIEVL